jgi:hypothetical protein
MIPFILLVSIAVFAYWFFRNIFIKKKTGNEQVKVNTEFLEKNVLFYEKLKEDEKKQFANKISEFLEQVKITGVDTNVDETDKILIAAAACIPIFYFKQWKYHSLQEVLLYSDAINMNFESTGNAARNILGMVGSGSLEGKMLLSKNALLQGFENKSDKSNTAIHEFVHLIDQSDGETDGIPNVMLDKQYVVPWINMIYEQIQEITKGKSDINPYAIMNKAEFFAVAAEYFFKRPELLEEKHPKLYEMLKEMFTKPQGFHKQ